MLQDFNVQKYQKENAEKLIIGKNQQKCLL